MNQDYFQQQIDQPLFQNLIWSRPETQQAAGKLLIIGGQAQEFIHVAECYAACEEAGAGSIRVLMPDSTRKITKMLPIIEYAPSNTSGSFAREALAELLDAGEWADGVVLAGDLGKNSETSLLLESFIQKYSGLLVVSQHAFSSLSINTYELFNRPNTVLIMSLAEFQKRGIQLELEKPVTSQIGNVDLAAVLHTTSQLFPANIIISQQNYIWVAHNGLVSLTTSRQTKSPGQVSAQSAVWLIQNSTKPYQALTTAAFC